MRLFRRGRLRVQLLPPGHEPRPTQPSTVHVLGLLLDWCAESLGQLACEFVRMLPGLLMLFVGIPLVVGAVVWACGP